MSKILNTFQKRRGNAPYATPEQLVASIRPGDRVTILVPAGIGRAGQEWSERTGRAMICSGTHAAINLGGRFGTPGVATPENIVSVRKAKTQTPRERGQDFLQRIEEGTL